MGVFQPPFVFEYEAHVLQVDEQPASRHEHIAHHAKVSG